MSTHWTDDVEQSDDEESYVPPIEHEFSPWYIIENDLETNRLREIDIYFNPKHKWVVYRFYSIHGILNTEPYGYVYPLLYVGQTSEFAVRVKNHKVEYSERVACPIFGL